MSIGFLITDLRPFQKQTSTSNIYPFAEKQRIYDPWLATLYQEPELGRIPRIRPPRIAKTNILEPSVNNYKILPRKLHNIPKCIIGVTSSNHSNRFYMKKKNPEVKCLKQLEEI